MENDNSVRITDKTYCNINEAVYGFFIDNEYLYHCFTEDLAKEFLEDIVKDLESKYKKANPHHRVFVEKINEWKFHIQRSRDGFLLSGKPRLTHVIEIRQSQKLVKCIQVDE